MINGPSRCGKTTACVWLLDNISLLERPLSSIIIVAKVEQRYYDKLGQRYDTDVILIFLNWISIVFHVVQHFSFMILTRESPGVNRYVQLHVYVHVHVYVQLPFHQLYS